MSGKRQATTDLNHDNWDKEEEPEERGAYPTASEEEMKGRIIKKARRSAGAAASSIDNKKSIFSGFTGFTTTTATSSSSSPFGFLTNKALPVSSSSFNTAANNKVTFSFENSPSKKAKEDFTINKNSEDNSSTDAKRDKPLSYYSKLKGLNLAVSEWIKMNVDENPLCILSPVFKDYEKYLEDIEKDAVTAVQTSEKPSTIELKLSEYLSSSSSASNTSVTTPTAVTSTITKTTSIFGNISKTSIDPPKTNGLSIGGDKDKGAPSSTISSFKFGIPTSTDSEPKISSGFTFMPTTSTTSIFGNIAKPSSDPSKTNGTEIGADKDTVTKSTPISSFNFGVPTTTASEASTSKFSFMPGSVPFSFGNIQTQSSSAPNTTTTEKGEDEEEYQPPKEEIKKVVEDDAIFSKKCKVFVKKHDTFVDRGVGTLYLKPVTNSAKTQLIIRADTNLGNILANLILSEGLPAQRSGKNNVMMVCIPTPEEKQPAPMLLRVKTAEEADELLEMINKHKK